MITCECGQIFPGLKVPDNHVLENRSMHRLRTAESIERAK